MNKAIPIAAAAAAVLAIAGLGWLLWPSPGPAPAEMAPQANIAPPPVPATAPPSTAQALQTGRAPQNAGPPAAAPPPATVPPAAPPAATVPPVAAPATGDVAPPRAAWPQVFRIETADEKHIRDHVAPASGPSLSVFRFAPNPRVIVLVFASLREQGHMLNRAAAFVEKAGQPHDRVLNDAELDAAVRAGGDTVETFYYGHDYGASGLARFFALADRDGIQLLREEEALRRLIQQEKWFEPNVNGGLISIPQVGADSNITSQARAAILHHELSHGEYFTNPAYTAFTRRFWTQTLTAAERERIRRFLRALGYEPSIEHVMENEAQAYLMFTDSAEFFTPEMIGMTKPRLAELRATFHRTMPAGWLRDDLGQAIGTGGGPAKRP